MTELIFTFFLIISLLLIFILQYYLEKRGLFFALIIFNILTFILSFKLTTIFKMNINLGIVTYISSLTTIYIYIIKYGQKEKKELILISLIANIITAILISIMNYYIPAITETISINMAGAFEYNYKILITYPIILIISQYCTIRLYSFVSSLQNNISISLILTYIITGIIYTIIFSIISYINNLSLKESIFIGITTYIIGIIVTIINTIFVKFIITSKKVTKWEISSWSF